MHIIPNDNKICNIYINMKKKIAKIWAKNLTAYANLNTMHKGAPPEEMAFNISERFDRAMPSHNL